MALKTRPAQHRPARAAAGAAEGACKRVVEGRVVEVRSGRVAFVTRSGREIDCRVPLHISIPWLVEALARGAVEAEAAVQEGQECGSLWSVFPGPEHAGVLPSSVEIAATGTVRLACGASNITLKDGQVRVRSRDVIVNGTRATRIRGGTVKVN